METQRGIGWIENRGERGRKREEKDRADRKGPAREGEFGFQRVRRLRTERVGNGSALSHDIA